MFNKVFIAALTVPAVLAWGPDGHATVADAGNKFFNDNANKAVAEILGEGVRMADFASWPDRALHGPDRSEWKWSSGLHYADADDNCKFIYSRDCKNDYCVAGGIKNYTRQVADTSLPLEQRQVALKFLMHFMGDIHQPLHVGRRSDYGGNTIKVDMKFANYEHGALHKAWDEKMIDQLEGSQYDGDYVQQDANYSTPLADRDMFWGITVSDILEELSEGGAFHDKIPEWLADCEANGLDECVNTMVSETGAVACSDAYRHVDGEEVVKGDVLPMEYYNNRIEIVKEQLAKGAVRFAWVMNNAFPEDPTVTTKPAAVNCFDADKKCDLAYPGSYCKYWQTVPVCFGSNVPCSC
ncbi:hypothetical protein FOZ63_025411 [Perkinsus olseni]|uniref:Nuclease S1 n=1 Tax=Perkinsus olseni TaxID=32597 RepID=A0A7J6S791_PEROL|nr:hypothetical protein FOZ63_025411 [Perkinsus olseni]KAF4748952.1 hypothetical protein FOZ62_023717 [Perkinsus olseni]